MEKVSLYIPCYNAERYIAKCIEGALRQTRRLEEIIVVDDGSTDRSMEIASRYPVRIVKHKQNRGLAAARNTGVRSSECELVASLDADCIPRPNWLEKMLEGLKSDKVAGVGGKLVELNQTTLPDRWRTLHMLQHHGSRMKINVHFIWGHSTVFRKSALENVGLYKEILRTNSEDNYICQKLLAAGFSLTYQPEAVVDHMRTDSLPSVIDNFRRWHFYGYQNDINFTNTTLNLAKNVGWRLPKLLLEDMQARQIDCALLSLFIICHNVLADLHYYMRNRGQRSLFLS
jgi:glycosyltransferase involved in cell wall biosynthesis